MLKSLHLAALAALSVSCLTLRAAPMDSPTLAAATTAGSGEGSAQRATGVPTATGGVSLKVAYADTLPGVSALFAVRACAYDERSGAYPRLIEVKSATPADIELQLVDERGVEVSHYSGSKAVCDYARFAAAFAARSHEKKEISHE